MKKTLLFYAFLTQGEENRDMRARLTLTSTVNSFIVAVLTVPRPVAEFIEMNTFLRPDTLHVVEGTSDHRLLRA